MIIKGSETLDHKPNPMHGASMLSSHDLNCTLSRFVEPRLPATRDNTSGELQTADCKRALPFSQRGLLLSTHDAAGRRHCDKSFKVPRDGSHTWSSIQKKGSPEKSRYEKISVKCGVPSSTCRNRGECPCQMCSSDRENRMNSSSSRVVLPCCNDHVRSLVYTNRKVRAHARDISGGSMPMEIDPDRTSSPTTGLRESTV
jgi:hypothetical protein